MNEEKKKHELRVGLPKKKKLKSHESRRLAMRNQIMSYLIYKETEFMIQH